MANPCNLEIVICNNLSTKAPFPGEEYLPDDIEKARGPVFMEGVFAPNQLPNAKIPCFHILPTLGLTQTVQFLDQHFPNTEYTVMLQSFPQGNPIDHLDTLLKTVRTITVDRWLTLSNDGVLEHLADGELTPDDIEALGADLVAGTHFLALFNGLSPYVPNPTTSYWTIEPQDEQPELVVTYIKCIHPPLYTSPNANGFPYVNLTFKTTFHIHRRLFAEPGFSIALYASNELLVQSMIRLKLSQSAPFMDDNCFQWPLFTPAGYRIDKNSVDRWNLTTPDSNTYVIQDWIMKDQLTLSRSNLHLLSAPVEEFRSWVETQKCSFRVDQYFTLLTAEHVHEF
ncbi:hypothetical protein FRB99_003695 [Tulasnella sp. 403]|nr:hypothetical protein FRB99_003695 [Tulasnella sp. 403]